MHNPVGNSKAKGPYSVALESGGLVFLSGQGGIDPSTGERVSGGIQAETQQTLENIQSVLAEAGLSIADLISMTCYLVDIAEWQLMNDTYSAFFGDLPGPTRTAVEVADLPFSLRVEMTAVAVRE